MLESKVKAYEKKHNQKPNEEQLNKIKENVEKRKNNKFTRWNRNWI